MEARREFQSDFSTLSLSSTELVILSYAGFNFEPNIPVIASSSYCYWEFGRRRKYPPVALNKPNPARVLRTKLRLFVESARIISEPLRWILEK